MKLNVKQIVDGVLGWDLVLELGGFEFATRCPTVGELAMMTQGGVDMQTLTAVVGGLFVEPRPDLSVLTPDELQVIVMAFGEAMRGRAEKNASALAGLIRGKSQGSLKP